MVPPISRKARARPPRLALLLALVALATAPRARAAPAECPEVPRQALHLAHSAATLAAGQTLRVLAFGSSSTEGSGASNPAATYPAQLEARLRAALPGHRVEVLNRGRGGEDVLAMRARLRQDVIAATPTLVIWQLGANAALRGMEPARFRAALDEGLERLRRRGLDIVLMDSQRAPRIASAQDAQRIGETLRAAAAAHGLAVFSREALMRGWEARGLPNAAVIGPDGLHHNDRGYACVAEALAEAILAGIGPLRPASLRR